MNEPTFSNETDILIKKLIEKRKARQKRKEKEHRDKESVTSKIRAQTELSINIQLVTVSKILNDIISQSPTADRLLRDTPFHLLSDDHRKRVIPFEKMCETILAHDLVTVSLCFVQENDVNEGNWCIRLLESDGYHNALHQWCAVAKPHYDEINQVNFWNYLSNLHDEQILAEILVNTVRLQ